MLVALADTVPFSWDLLADFQILFRYHFMQNAYLVGTLVALAAGMIGYFMVLRDQSFAGHSLANVGFAGATGALLFGITPVVGLFIAGVLAAVGIQTLNVAARQKRQSDIAVGAVLTASLALGFLFVHLSTKQTNNVIDVLFGNVLGISDSDVTVVAWSTLLLMAVLLFIARPLFFASVDPDVAAAHGVPVRLLSSGYLVLLALEVAVAVQVVGVLLIFALLVTPAAIAQYVTTRPAVAVLVAIGLALLFTWAGLLAGFLPPYYPVSFFITTFAFATYVLVRGVRFVQNFLARHRLASRPGSSVGGTV